MKKVAVYPGTFDPITYGHIDVIKKSLKLFERIVIAVSDGANKNYLFNSDERIRFNASSTVWMSGFASAMYCGIHQPSSPVSEKTSAA